MVARPVSEASYDGARFTRVLNEFRTAGRMDMAFGGPVRPDVSGLTITDLCGNLTRSLLNLHVRAGDGLGGKAIVMGKPASVANYFTARGITHRYDHNVRAEKLVTLTALPVVVDRAPRMLVYVASRGKVNLGDRWYDSFVPLVRSIERDLAVEDEVRRRLALLGLSPGAAAPRIRLTEDDLTDISRELADLATRIEDPELRARLEQVRSRVAEGRAPDRRQPPRKPGVGLTAREVDVIQQVALGNTNREVAENLGLVESTVKTYLKNAARKLQASNRVHAVRLAREAGVID